VLSVKSGLWADADEMDLDVRFGANGDRSQAKDQKCSRFTFDSSNLLEHDSNFQSMITALREISL
jgi:hypothetical protein